MRLKTKIKGKTISYNWNIPLIGFKGRSLYLKYDIDISKTPEHITNFLFGILMQDCITLTGNTLILNELTEKEEYHLQKTLDMSHNSCGCAGKKRGYKVKDKPQIETTRIVEPSQTDGNGPIICANGMGKDGINIALIVKELGLTPRCYTLVNQYKTIKRGLWKERWKTTNAFYKQNKIEDNLVETNFFKERGDKIGFYPYVAGLPLAYHYDSNVILDGIQIHNNKTRIDDGTFYCPGETIFAFNHVSKATGITTSSPMRPLSNYGAQKLLVQKWPQFLKHQRSCMYGSPWCGECSKCNRKALYLDTLGINPEQFKLPKFKEEKLALFEYGPVQDSVVQVLAKHRGEPYKDWIDGANEHALSLIWEGKNIRKILQEHFSTYTKDPGPDGRGYTLTPSKWEEWINE